MQLEQALVFPRLRRPSGRVWLFTGPPGGGKSHRVQLERADGDEVIDLDEIVAEISGLPIYQADRMVWLEAGLQERNRRLESLSRMPRDKRALVVVCAPGRAFAGWRAALRPERVVSIVPRPDVAEAQIRSDPRRQHEVEAHIAACREWYAREASARQRAMSRAADEEVRDAA